MSEWVDRHPSTRVETPRGDGRRSPSPPTPDSTSLSTGIVLRSHYCSLYYPFLRECPSHPVYRVWFFNNNKKLREKYLCDIVDLQHNSMRSDCAPVLPRLNVSASKLKTNLLIEYINPTLTMSYLGWTVFVFLSECAIKLLTLIIK